MPLQMAAIKLTAKRLLRHGEIVAAAELAAPQCGVYFLVCRGQVAYVGQSINIAARLSGHTKKEYDSVAYVPCERSQLDALETLYIHLLQPPLNLTSQGYLPAPLSLPDLLDRLNGMGVPA